MEIYEINSLLKDLFEELDLINEELNDFVNINNSLFGLEEINSLKDKLNELSENNKKIVEKLKV